MSSYPDADDEYDPEVENLPYETRQRVEKNKFKFPGFKWTTTNDLARYAQDKHKYSDTLLPSTPKMLEINEYLISPAFERKTLFTELNLAMLELLLDLPIMWNIELENGEEIDLNDKNNINFQDQCFEQAIEILNVLLDAGVVKKEELRIPYEELEMLSKKQV